MNKKNLLIYLELTLIVILLICSFAMEYKGNNFNRDCIETYSINKSCPCRQTKFDYKPINLSHLNFNISNN